MLTLIKYLNYKQCTVMQLIIRIYLKLYSQSVDPGKFTHFLQVNIILTLGSLQSTDFTSFKNRKSLPSPQTTTNDWYALKLEIQRRGCQRFLNTPTLKMWNNWTTVEVQTGTKRYKRLVQVSNQNLEVGVLGTWTNKDLIMCLTLLCIFYLYKYKGNQNYKYKIIIGNFTQGGWGNVRRRLTKQPYKK